ncbi:daunorubicin resistance protein DrrA family ABC transporter ATP-binding protein [Dactylosporangium matsuzakiense]|uniref:Daunorubicin resistance protein DrrA family ABC transporter ATP-binding protein n=1 Tax=Dactylosporangium matsuzakiense TaxID=53360 RepID=A0A9W6NNM7_9ACTN|nr:daunorubicin resistance protein DrrA family ABC transporter ATP-binding protein [Dactylosporangium matsuzakiense]
MGCFGTTIGRVQGVNVDTSFAIRAVGLKKAFGATRAVNGIDLTVPAGTVYGILGPNGAGKTTTIRMLATLLRPDAGTAEVFGHDVVRAAATVRGLISLTGQFASVDGSLTGRQNLVLLGRLVGYSRAAARQRAADLLAAFDLGDAGDRLAKTYSGGMQRRLDIAASVLSAPRLIFLDEPTAGLDPRSRNQVWDTVRAVVASGTTVLLTTQYLEEADQLADRIAVIDNGGVIAEGTPGELKASVGSSAVHVRLLDPAQRPAAEQVLTRVLGAPVHPGSDPARLAVSASDPGRAGAALTALSTAGVGVADFSLGRPSLDEVFLTLTDRPAGVAAGAEETA